MAKTGDNHSIPNKPQANMTESSANMTVDSYIPKRPIDMSAKIEIKSIQLAIHNIVSHFLFISLLTFKLSGAVFSRPLERFVLNSPIRVSLQST